MDHILRYFRRRRADAIQQYMADGVWPKRSDARDWALHYGRLVRMMEASQ